MDRDEFGLLIIDDYVPDNKKYKKQFEFDMNGKHYFYKDVYKVNDIYNGLIAFEIAEEMGIDVCPVDIVSNNESIGVISESLLSRYDNAYTIEELINEFTKSPNSHNNLEDIWDYIDKKYKDSRITLNLMRELVRVFMFDCLIGNNDRHSDNLMIVEKHGIPSIYPLYDNDLILTDVALYDRFYSLRVSEDNYEDILREFIHSSDKMFRDELEEYLEIINEKYIPFIIERIETRIGVPMMESVKENIIERFKFNYFYIKSVIEESKGKELKRG